MTEFLASSALFAVALTFFAYELGRLFQQKLRLPIFNPILIAASKSCGCPSSTPS